MNDYYPWTLTIINSTGELAVPVREAERAYDALRAEVERLRDELGRTDDERIHQHGLAQQRLVEINRLRALVVSVESVEGLCPWCSGPDFTHYPDCSAFSARGEVRK